MYFRIIKLLQKYGCKVVWLDCDIEVARKRYKERNSRQPIAIFETQMQNIKSNWEKIIREINPFGYQCS